MRGLWSTLQVDEGTRRVDKRPREEKEPPTTPLPKSRKIRIRGGQRVQARRVLDMFVDRDYDLLYAWANGIPVKGNGKGNGKGKKGWALPFARGHEWWLNASR